MVKLSENLVVLLGTVGGNVEFKEVGNDKKHLLKFSVVTNRLDEDRKERSSWIPVLVWGKMADSLANFIEKGRVVYVKGSWRNSVYKAKKGYTKRHSYCQAALVICMPKKEKPLDPEKEMSEEYEYPKEWDEMNEEEEPL